MTDGTVKIQRLIVIIGLDPNIENPEQPREVSEADIMEMVKNAIITDGAQLSCWGSKGGAFSEIPEGYTREQAIDAFDRHLLDNLFAGKLQNLAKTPEGRLAMLQVINQANRADEAGDGNAFFSDADLNPTKQ